MQSIKQLLNNNLSTSSGKPAREDYNEQHLTIKPEQPIHSPDREKVIDRLFLKLSAIYGNSWRNLYRTNEFILFSKKQWLDALDEFDEPLLSQAINVCRQHYKFAPNIPEFIDCCRQLKKKDNFFRAIA